MNVKSTAMCHLHGTRGYYKAPLTHPNNLLRLQPELSITKVPTAPIYYDMTGVPLHFT